MTDLLGTEVNQIEITVRTVRQTLNQWDFPAKLGQTALAGMESVSNILQRSNQADTIINRGLALKEQLNLAIQALRPNTNEPRPLEREWRAYLVIIERYCYGRLPEWIMVHLSISSRTFYRELNSGLGEIAATLQQAESRAFMPGSKPTPVTKASGKEQNSLFLPPRPPDYPIVGREQVVQQIAHELLNEQKPLIALHGIPGVGKSTVALTIAQLAKISARFSDGIIWIGVGPKPNPHALLISLAQKVGISADTLKNIDPPKMAELIRHQIADQKLLIVLDDIWDIQTGHLLCLGGRQAVHLITTRQPDIALTLAGAAVISIEELSSQNSQQILKALAPEITAHSDIDLNRLYEQTGGLPLALVIFGKYLHKHGYRGQLTRLNAALSRLAKKQTRLNLELTSSPIGSKLKQENGQINLAAVIGLSTGALPSEMMQALKNLTFFNAKPNSLSQEAALCLCSGSAENLYGLVDCGLLEIVETDRYGLHPLIHDYVSLQNQEQFIPDHTRNELLKFGVEVCSKHSQNFQTLDLESRNIEAILEHSFGKKTIESMSKILFGYTSYLIDRGRISYAKTSAERALNLAQDLKDQAAEARLLFCLGAISRLQESAEDTIRHLEKGQLLAAELKLEALDFRLKIDLIKIYMRSGRPKKALELAETIRQEIKSETGNEYKAQAYVGLSYVYYFHGNYQSAFDLVSQARDILERSKKETHVSELAGIYQKLGVLSIELGQFSSAAVYYDLAYERYRLLNNQGQAAHLLNNMGVLALKKGQWMRAINLHKQALELRKTLEDQAGQGQSYLNLAVIAVTQKDISRAQHYIKEGMRLSETSGMRYRKSLFKLLDAWLSRVQGYFEQALATATDAFNLAQELERDQTAGEAAMEQGYAMLRLDRFDAAEKKLQFAHSLWEDNQQAHLLTATNIYLAQVANKQQDMKKAKKHLSAGLAYLDQGVDGLDDTMDVLQMCVSILESLGDEKNAARYKQKALTYLKQQSLQIEDPAVRRFFTNSFNL